MKKVLLMGMSALFSSVALAQCPNLLQAMVNSCGTTEGNNEFVVFETSVTANASTYKLNYGSANPPTVNNLAGSDAGPIIGTGSVTTTGTCSAVSVTSPSTSIPAGSRVIFVPSNLDQNYDVTGLCNGASTLYVVYIKTNSNGGSNSNWSNSGTMSNSASTPRYLQVTYSGSTACNGSNAPVKNYIASGNWPVLSGTVADGNFVTWNDTTAGYYNNGCTTIIVPVTLLSFQAIYQNGNGLLKWQTSQEINTASFVIEKSYNGKQFFTAGSVVAAGTSNRTLQYQFTDYGMQSAITFYRIKTNDKDGKASYSNIARINPLKNNANGLQIQPQPVGNEFSIQWNGRSKSNGTLQIFDLSGRLMQQISILEIQGLNRKTISSAQLPAGQYVAKLVTANEVLTSRFSK
jgi:hypothetical protein